MQSALRDVDVETLNRLRTESERVLSGKRGVGKGYELAEARVVLYGIQFLERIDNQFDFYTGEGSALPETLITSELNLNDPDSWIVKVMNLPGHFPWKGNDVSATAFSGVNDCLRMMANEFVRIAPTQNTMKLQDEIALLHNDVYKYLSGFHSNEDLARDYHSVLSVIPLVRIDLGRVETKRRERILHTPSRTRTKHLAAELIPDLIDVPRGHRDVEYFGLLAKRYRQLEEYWNDIEPSEFCGYDYAMRWQAHEVESVVEAAKAVKFLRREFEAKQINPMRPIARHFGKETTMVRSIFTALHNYAFNRRVLSHEVFRDVLKVFVDEDFSCFLGIKHDIALNSFWEFAESFDSFESSLRSGDEITPRDAYDMLVRKYNAFTEELVEAEQWLRPVFCNNDYEAEETYENIEGNIQLSNSDLNGVNDYLYGLPDGLATTKGLTFENGLKFKDGFNPNQNIMDGMLLGMNWFHYWTSGGPDGIQELLGENRGHWHMFFSLIGKKFLFLKEASVDARDAFDEYINFVQDSDRFHVNNAAAEVTRQDLLKRFRDVLLSISRMFVEYWDKSYTPSARSSLTCKAKTSLKEDDIARVAEAAGKVLTPHFQSLCKVQGEILSATEKVHRTVQRKTNAILGDTAALKGGVKDVLREYGAVKELTDHDQGGKVVYRPRAKGVDLKMLQEAYVRYVGGEKRGAAAAKVFAAHKGNTGSYKDKAGFTTAVYRYCDGMDRNKAKQL